MTTKTILLTLFFYLLFQCAYSQCTEQKSNTLQDLNSVYFLNENIGYSVGTNGTIAKTTNGGENWVLQRSSTMEHLNSVFFINDSVGFAVGNIILKTTNGGNNWTNISNAYSIRAICFIDNKTGFISGANGQIYKTIDGGDSWFSQSSGTTKSLTSIYFTSSTVGYAVGGDNGLGIIIKTIDGGNTWNTIVENSIKLLYSIQFTNATTGYATGLEGKIYKTENSGTTWNTIFDCTKSLLSLYFLNESTGIAVGWNMLRTVDGGKTWTTDNSFSNTDSSGQTRILESVFIPSSKSAYAVGWRGTILKLDHILGINETSYNNNHNTLNYPNPFNAATTITYKIQGQKDVSIKIYDLLGKLIDTLIEGERTTGKYDVCYEGSHLQSGIYFYNIYYSNNLIERKKMIKID